MWSWSPRHDIAIGFARREFGNAPRVVRGTLFLPRAMACFFDYDEQELVADPRQVGGREYTTDYPVSEPFAA